MASVLVSYLSISGPPAGAVLAPPVAGVQIATERLVADAYIGLYRAVGEPWGWDQRTRLPLAMLESYLAGPNCVIFVLRAANGAAIGFCEFDCSNQTSVQLMNFGIVPGEQRKGFGPYLLDYSLRAICDAHRPATIWLHTDTGDHPGALALYLRAGFEIFDERVQDAAEL